MLKHIRGYIGMMRIMHTKIIRKIEKLKPLTACRRLLRLILLVLLLSLGGRAGWVRISGHISKISNL